jgi:hypothetical protein
VTKTRDLALLNTYTVTEFNELELENAPSSEVTQRAMVGFELKIEKEKKK